MVMRKTLWLAVAVFILLIGAVTGFVFSRSAQPVGIRMHAKDLPNHGLIIIKPSDPEFDGLATNLIKGISEDDLDALKPFSVIIQNTGDKRLIAYALIWEGIDADGKRVSYKKTYANSEPLTDGEEALQALARTHLDKTIKPGDMLLVSLLPVASQGGGSGMGMEKREQDARESYTDITASIDGAFFDDGSFVGPDSTNFFNLLKAQVDAKLEVIDTLSESIKLKKTKAEIFRAIEANLNDPIAHLTYQSTPAEHYNYFKKFFSAYFLKLRQVSGEDKTLDTVLHLKAKPRPKLRKLQ